MTGAKRLINLLCLKIACHLPNPNRTQKNLTDIVNKTIFSQKCCYTGMFLQ